MINDLFQDQQFGLRTLKKSPGFTAVAVVTLALAIGGNAAIFSFVDGFMLKPLPYAESDRIVRVLEKPPGGGRNGISTLNYLDWAKQNTVFEYMAAQTGGAVTLTGIQEPQQLRGAQVSARYFEIFGIKPVWGRTFSPDEDQVGKGNVAIISHSLWETQFGADRGILSRKILLDGRPYDVIGVLPAGGAFDREFAQIWRPLVFEPENMTRNYHWMGSFALLKRGVTLQQAQAQMDTIAARIASEYPDSNKGWGIGIDRYEDAIVGPDLRRVLMILMSAAGMVLLIGCANLANLLMARSSSREREVAVRASLGAGRWRLVRQFLTESILLSLGGGIFGIGVGYAGMAAVRAAIPPFSLPREFNVTMDGRVLLFALAISVLTGILFGLVPAVHTARPDLAATVKEGPQGGTAGGQRSHSRRVLVVAEIALAFVLLTGAGLLLRSFYRIMHVDPGFDATNVITAGVPISPKQIPDPVRLNNYLREIVVRIEAVPGVLEASLTSALPLQGWGYGMPYQVDGRPLKDRANRQACFFKMVEISYFHTLGIQLSRGRGLSKTDVHGAPPVAVINQTLARREFPNEDPIGRRILVQEIVPGKTELGPEIPWQIVGVIKDEKINSLNDERSAGMYVSVEQSPVYGVALVARALMNPLALERSLRAAVQEVNRDQPLTDVRTLERITSESTLGDRLLTELLGIFAAVAILLAAVGIYGVTSYSVSLRTRELGIRAALGANAGDLTHMILRGGLTLTVLGLVLGACGAFGLTRLMQNLLFGVSVRDPATFVVVAVALGGVALFACYIPARRAAKADPAVALRYE
jgi:putative ABC transport system permease protein